MQKQLNEILSLYTENAAEMDQNLPVSTIKDEDPSNENDHVAARSLLEKQGSTQPALDATLDGSEITLDHSNISQVTLRFYKMDLELLFSSNPFMFQKLSTGNSMFIMPNYTMSTVVSSGTGQSSTIPIPSQLLVDNLMIEVMSVGIRKTLSYYSNSIRVNIDKSGQIQVLTRQSRRPIPRAYIKVYAQDHNQKNHFWLDTYTDLRGRADYCSISDWAIPIGNVNKFAILVMTPGHGSVIKEAHPPKIG